MNATALNSYFQYTPSLPGNIIYLLAFILITIALAWLTWRSGPNGRVMWIVVFTGNATAAEWHEHADLRTRLHLLLRCRGDRDGRLHSTYCCEADGRA